MAPSGGERQAEDAGGLQRAAPRLSVQPPATEQPATAPNLLKFTGAYMPMASPVLSRWYANVEDVDTPSGHQWAVVSWW